MFGARHLPEDRLFDCYLAEQTGERLEPPSAEHLSDCPRCAARYADLRRFMNGLRTEADEELDEVFSIDMFRAQQLHVLRRLEQLAHPARVISFPGHPPGQAAAAPRARLAPRWIGAAAAAGLLVGVAAGSLIYTGASSDDSAQMAVRDSAHVAPSVTFDGPPDPQSDSSGTDLNDLNEKFLSELEIALERPHTPELVAIDDLTPHVREVRVQLR